MIKIYSLAALLLSTLPLALQATPVAGGRMILVPNYAYRAGAGFLVAVGPPTVPATGTPIGMVIHHIISLINLSNIAQPGKLILKSESLANGTEDAPIPLYYFAKHFYLCGVDQMGGIYTKQSADVAANVFTSPTLTVTYSIAPFSAIQAEVGVFFSGVLAYNNPAAGGAAIDAIFSPVLEIDVDSAKGAVQASMTAFNDYPSPAGVLCDSTSLASYTGAAANYGGASVPLLINGGRPF